MKLQSAERGDREGALENRLPERRRFARHQCSLPVQLHVAGQAYPTSSEITDISLGGCYVKMLLPLPVGTAVEIRIGTDGAEIQAKGTVTGEIHTPCLVIEPGGIFDGQCHMLAASEASKPLTIPIRAAQQG